MWKCLQDLVVIATNEAMKKARRTNELHYGTIHERIEPAWNVLGGKNMHYPEPISKLIDSFMKLPGIGPKTAGRLAFFVLSMKEDTVLDFAKALS